MKAYLVEGGPVTIGAGALIGLTAAQHELRQESLEIVGEPSKDGAVVCKALTAQQFKVGEKIALEDLPKALVERLLPLEKATTPTEILAVEKRDERRAEAKKTKRGS